MNAIILSAVFGVIMMLCSFLVPKQSMHRHIASVCLLLLLIFNIADTYNHPLFTFNTYDMLIYTKFGMFFNSLAIGATLIYVLLTGKEIENVNRHSAEYFALIFFVLCGVALLSSYNNLLTLFLGIEILSIPLYILTGSDKRNLKSNEAALKYFLMGAFSTGIMLMGIALTYGGTGTFNMEVPSRGAVGGYYKGIASFLEVTGLIFLLIAMAFKVSAAPFHFWTPDVYDGAPGVFTSFMATIVKAAAFIAFIRLCNVRMQETERAVNWQMLFAILIFATLLVGNITAVFQHSVKRMLAYSSIAQAGFMMFALLSWNEISNEGILLYAISYSLATIGIFAILVKMKDYTFEGYNGLAKTQPALAAANTIFLLSLAGIPLTAGFFAKYFMLAAVLKSGSYTWLVIAAVLFAAVSVYYYFRVIQAMYFRQGNPATSQITPSFKAGILLLAAFIILIGILPTIILNWFYF